MEGFLVVVVMVVDMMAYLTILNGKMVAKLIMKNCVTNEIKLQAKSE